LAGVPWLACRRGQAGVWQRRSHPGEDAQRAVALLSRATELSQATSRAEQTEQAGKPSQAMQAEPGK